MAETPYALLAGILSTASATPPASACRAGSSSTRTSPFLLRVAPQQRRGTLEDERASWHRARFSQLRGASTAPRSAFLHLEGPRLRPSGAPPVNKTPGRWEAPPDFIGRTLGGVQIEGSRPGLRQAGPDRVRFRADTQRASLSLYCPRAVRSSTRSRSVSSFRPNPCSLFNPCEWIRPP